MSALECNVAVEVLLQTVECGNGRTSTPSHTPKALGGARLLYSAILLGPHGGSSEGRTRGGVGGV